MTSVSASGAIAGQSSRLHTVVHVRDILQRLSQQAHDLLKFPVNESSFDMLRNCQLEMLGVIDRAIQTLAPEVACSTEEMAKLTESSLDRDVSDALQHCLCAQEEHAHSLTNKLRVLAVETHMICTDEARRELDEIAGESGGNETYSGAYSADLSALEASELHGEARSLRQRSLDLLIQREKDRTHQLHSFITRHFEELIRQQFSQINVEVRRLRGIGDEQRANMIWKLSRTLDAEASSPESSSQLLPLIYDSACRISEDVANYHQGGVEELRSVMLERMRCLMQQISESKSSPSRPTKRVDCGVAGDGDPNLDLNPAFEKIAASSSAIAEDMLGSSAATTCRVLTPLATSDSITVDPVLAAENAASCGSGAAPPYACTAGAPPPPSWSCGDAAAGSNLGGASDEGSPASPKLSSSQISLGFSEHMHRSRTVSEISGVPLPIHHRHTLSSASRQMDTRERAKVEERAKTEAARRLCQKAASTSRSPSPTASRGNSRNASPAASRGTSPVRGTAAASPTASRASSPSASTRDLAERTGQLSLRKLPNQDIRARPVGQPSMRPMPQRGRIPAPSGRRGSLSCSPPPVVSRTAASAPQLEKKPPVPLAPRPSSPLRSANNSVAAFPAMERRPPVPLSSKTFGLRKSASESVFPAKMSVTTERSRDRIVPADTLARAAASLETLVAEPTDMEIAEPLASASDSLAPTCTPQESPTQSIDIASSTEATIDTLVASNATSSTPAFPERVEVRCLYPEARRKDLSVVARSYTEPSPRQASLPPQGPSFRDDNQDTDLHNPLRALPPHAELVEPVGLRRRKVSPLGVRHPLVSYTTQPDELGVRHPLMSWESGTRSPPTVFFSSATQQATSTTTIVQPLDPSRISTSPGPTGYNNPGGGYLLGRLGPPSCLLPTMAPGSAQPVLSPESSARIAAPGCLASNTLLAALQHQKPSLLPSPGPPAHERMTQSVSSSPALEHLGRFSLQNTRC